MELTEARLRATAIELDAERQAQGMTYQDIADQLGVEKPTAHRYLRGRNGKPADLTLTTVLQLTEILQVDVLELFERVDKRADKLRRAESE